MLRKKVFCTLSLVLGITLLSTSLHTYAWGLNTHGYAAKLYIDGLGTRYQWTPEFLGGVIMGDCVSGMKPSNYSSILDSDHVDFQTALKKKVASSTDSGKKAFVNGMYSHYLQDNMVSGHLAHIPYTDLTGKQVKKAYLDEYVRDYKLYDVRNQSYIMYPDLIASTYLTLYPNLKVYAAGSSIVNMSSDIVMTGYYNSVATWEALMALSIGSYSASDKTQLDSELKEYSGACTRSWVSTTTTTSISSNSSTNTLTSSQSESGQTNKVENKVKKPSKESVDRAKKKCKDIIQEITDEKLLVLESKPIANSDGAYLVTIKTPDEEKYQKKLKDVAKRMNEVLVQENVSLEDAFDLQE